MDEEKLAYEKLSDGDLIQCFCSVPSDREAFDELWKRYEPTIRRFAGHLTQMCPASYSREIFQEDVFSETQERVLKQISGYQRRIPFSAWLWMVGQGAAIDKRRKIVGRDPKKPRFFGPLREEELARSGALFRDKVKEDPVRNVLERERLAIVKQVFDHYSKTQEGFDSLSALYLHFGENYGVSEVAKRFSTYERKVFRMFDHDCEALQGLFAEVGIRNLREILMD